MHSFFDYIEMKGCNKSKHSKIVDGVLQAVNDRKLQVGDMLPSVNNFVAQLGIARMTVVKAMNELKDRGVIESKNRVGYFVRNENVTRHLKVMLFLTTFDSYHEVLYNEVVSGLDIENVSIDLYFHHCNPDVFRAVLKEHLGLYGLYVVTPFQHPSVRRALNDIPKHKLLQVLRPPVISGTSYISQEFDEELFLALNQVKENIRKYNHFKLIFTEKRGYPEEIRKAFSSFCEHINMPNSIEKEVTEDMIQKNTAFFTIEDNDLIKVVKWTEEKGFRIGAEIGLISYNETPMKEIIRNGVTVISTDFKQIGMEIRKFIGTQKFVQKNISTKVIIRKSL
jgi:DNA-binding transcriptional regulator YhcF (GntR family)